MSYGVLSLAHKKMLSPAKYVFSARIEAVQKDASNDCSKVGHHSNQLNYFTLSKHSTIYYFKATGLSASSPTSPSGQREGVDHPSPHGNPAAKKRHAHDPHSKKIRRGSSKEE